MKLGNNDSTCGAAKWRKLRKGLRFKFYHYFKPSSVCNVKDLAGAAKGLDVMGELEKRCGVGKGKANCQLYQNSFGDYQCGMLLTGMKPGSDEKDYTLTKYLYFRVKVKYYVTVCRKYLDNVCIK